MPRSFYKTLVRPILFSLDSETAHEIAMGTMEKLSFQWIVHQLKSRLSVRDSRLEVSLFGKRFSNPLGLAAGFDKNCRAVPMLGAFGFGHVEIGTVTAQPQRGNPRPRIFRFPEYRALINAMGFPSAGALRVAERLAHLPQSGSEMILGLNIGKTKIVPLEDALLDYLETFSRVKRLADYFVLNVSSPNTPELRKLQEKPRLKALFQGFQVQNDESKPLLVKVSPDLSSGELDDVIDVCIECRIAGIIATNTTLNRPGLRGESHVGIAGGLSGEPLRTRSREVVSHIYQRTRGALPIIGVGGVSSVEDVIELMSAGASLVQLYTALIYEGPGLILRLQRGLLRYLEETGISSVSQLIGRDHAR